MDSLDKFAVFEDKDFVVKMHKDEAPVMQEYVLSLAHRAIDTLSKRYQFTPKGPILIEIFPKHDDFAVRNVGLPGMIGALGACFGRVVTMDSPRAPGRGGSQWEATLWHELAHVITLQMTNKRLPRWVSEGISSYEEALARREWGRGQDMQFASMLNAGQAIKLKDLNAAFQNPRLISIAYFQASVVIEYLVKTYGDEGPAPAAPRLRQRPRRERGAEGGVQHRLRLAPDRLRRARRKPIRRAAQGAQGTGG